MRVLIVFYLLFIGVLALLAQMILPAHIKLLGVIGFGSALIPLVVIYSSLELGDERGPIVAILLGLLLDLTTSHRLGISALMLGSLSALIITQAHRPESHNWIFRIIYVLIGTFAFLLVDYLFFLSETTRWYWPLDVWSKITFTSLLNVVLSPFFFFFVGFLPRRCGWRPDHENQDKYRAYA